MDESTETQRLDAIRHQLAVLARRKSARTLSWPRDWRPTQVRNPSFAEQEYFTPESAWEFVAELLEQGCPIEEMDLEDFPGRKGYVMQVDVGSDVPNLYIKLCLGAGKVIGISFHYSEFSQRGPV